MSSTVKGVVSVEIAMSMRTTIGLAPRLYNMRD
jgi:hypothetical protein